MRSPCAGSGGAISAAQGPRVFRRIAARKRFREAGSGNERLCNDSSRSPQQLLGMNRWRR